jgi:uncharacterized membrane protein YdcZ (DUF606 family)
MRPALRPEVLGAWVMGVALPVLEVARRRTNFHPIAAYVDDFIAGGLLLIAARSVSRRHPRGPVLLVAAWAVLCGGTYGSLVAQLSWTGADPSGLPNEVVVAIKAAIGVAALICLGLSIRAASPRDV